MKKNLHIITLSIIAASNIWTSDRAFFREEIPSRFIVKREENVLTMIKNPELKKFFERKLPATGTHIHNLLNQKDSSGKDIIELFKTISYAKSLFIKNSAYNPTIHGLFQTLTVLEEGNGETIKDGQRILITLKKRAFHNEYDEERLSLKDTQEPSSTKLILVEATNQYANFVGLKVGSKVLCALFNNSTTIIVEIHIRDNLE